MSNLRFLAVAVLAGLLGGCSTWYEWTKPGVTNSQLTQDVRECRAVAQIQGNADTDYERCMLARGYAIKEKQGALIKIGG